MFSNRLARHLRGWVQDRSIEIVIFLFLLSFLLVYFAPMMFYSVPAGHVGVLWKRFEGGTVVDRLPLQEGLQIIWPWDKLYIYDVRLQQSDEDFDVLSSDGLKLVVNVAWRYRLEPANVSYLHKYVGPEWKQILLEPEIGARLRDVVSKNTPEELYSDRRFAIAGEILKAADTNLEQKFNPDKTASIKWLLIEDVLIRDIKLPAGVEDAIVSQNEQYHLNQEYDFRLLREAKEAQRKKIEAEGIREFQAIVSSGITDSYLRWKGIDSTLQLAQSNNAKIVIIGNAKDGLPLILGGLDSLPQLSPAKPVVGPAVTPAAAAPKPNAAGPGTAAAPPPSATAPTLGEAPAVMPPPPEAASAPKAAGAGAPRPQAVTH